MSKPPANKGKGSKKPVISLATSSDVEEVAPTKRSDLSKKSTKRTAIAIPDSPDFNQSLPARKKRKLSEPVLFEAPWPSAESVHVTGQLSVRSDVNTVLTDKLCPKSYHKQSLSPNPKSNFWSLPTIQLPSLDDQQVSSSSATQRSARNACPKSDHPLVTRLMQPFYDELDLLRDEEDLSPMDSSNKTEIWTAAYAPKSAEEMLGSESRQSSRKLRDWLMLHEIKGKEANAKRQVTRQVQKPKKKKKRKDDYSSDLDDFLASEGDELEFESPRQTYELDSDPFSASSLHANGFKRKDDNQFENLTNLMLLAGPTSSGKTAAVYAVAHELGWQVFEISPGSGKRSPKELLQALGEVGRTHVVWKKASTQDAQQPTAKGSLASMFAKQDPAKPALANGTSKQKKTAPLITQSLILIEEVDILFHEDLSYDAFWTGVADFVKTSRKAVVMTCNDTSRVPYDRLPIQTTLFFVPPDVDEVVPFLQSVSMVEGCLLNVGALSQLYRWSAFQFLACQPSSSLAARPPLSLAYQDAPKPDLRHTLVQLQFNCSQLERFQDWMAPKLIARSESIEASAENPSPDLAAAYLCAERASEADAAIAQRPQMAMIHTDGFTTFPLEEMELGCDYLDVVEESTEPFSNAQIPRETEILEELLGSHSLAAAGEEKVVLQRSRFMRDADNVMSVLSIGEVTVPADAACAEIVPYLSLMVELDDECQQVFDAALGAGTDAMSMQQHSPIKRRSRRLHAPELDQYKRHLDVGPEYLARARNLRLSSS